MLFILRQTSNESELTKQNLHTANILTNNNTMNGELLRHLACTSGILRDGIFPHIIINCSTRRTTCVRIDFSKSLDNPVNVIIITIELSNNKALCCGVDCGLTILKCFRKITD